MINFSVNHEDAKKIDEVFGRAWKRTSVKDLYDSDGLALMMDLTAVHLNGCPMDWDKLLAADDFNFFHDVVGIYQNINRTTGQLDNCFLPRCAKSE